MKKNISIKGLVLLLALCLVGSFAMYGCGSDDKSSSKSDTGVSDTADKTSDDSDSLDDSDADAQTADITGEWVLDAIVDADGNSQTLEEYCAAQGVDTQGLDATYTFEEDGTVVGAVGGIGVEGTYEFDGEKVTSTINNSTSVFVYNEDDLIAKINEPEFVAGLDSILLKYRITNMKSHLHHKDKVKDYVVNHQTHLLQHISRIYRLRNELVHEAALKQDIENVASNLRFYLVFVLNQMVDYFSEDSTNMKSKTMLQFFWNYEKGLRAILSADSSEVVTVILDIHIAKSYIV